MQSAGFLHRGSAEPPGHAMASCASYTGRKSPYGLLMRFLIACLVVAALLLGLIFLVGEYGYFP
jgi:hypothetical protein